MSRIGQLELDTLEAFEAIASTRSFTKAAERLGSAQSSISDKISRLEARLGHRLIERTTRRLKITQAGHALLVYARGMLDLAEQARLHFEQPPLKGILRLGVSEDFIGGHLPQVLAVFRRIHPNFALTVRSGLSSSLFRMLDEGDLDVALAKRIPGRATGRSVGREKLEWVGDVAMLSSTQNVVPLVTYPNPSPTRALMLEALKDDKRRWTILAESESIAGVLAAVASGFGITAFSRRFAPPGVEFMPQACGLPDIGELEYVIDHRADPRDQAIEAFIEILAASASTVIDDDI